MIQRTMAIEGWTDEDAGKEISELLAESPEKFTELEEIKVLELSMSNRTHLENRSDFSVLKVSNIAIKLTPRSSGFEIFESAARFSVIILELIFKYIFEIKFHEKKIP